LRGETQDPKEHPNGIPLNENSPVCIERLWPARVLVFTFCFGFLNGFERRKTE
jgi:hypothetical protein